MALKPGPLRDALVLVAVFALLLGGLYAYTGTWPPAVIVESSSMMHRDDEVSYGRIGTIDPGDLVLVKNIDSPDDVTTLLDGGRERYGLSGDVIVYFPYDDRTSTPIIHRAVAYVEVAGSGTETTYRVRWNPDAECEGGATKSSDGRWCEYGAEGVYVPSVPIARLGSTPQTPQPYKPEHSGFLTKGDNPFTNRNIDQVSGLSQAVKLEWIEGKGRGELPWLGLIKLSLAGRPNERSPPDSWTKIGSAYAPSDLWTMLGISLFILVGVPLIYDAYKAIQARRVKGRTLLPPMGLNAAPDGTGGVVLRWSPAQHAHNYRVYRDDVLVGSTRETQYADAAVPLGRTYRYAVTTVDDAGTESPRTTPVSLELG